MTQLRVRLTDGIETLIKSRDHLDFLSYFCIFFSHYLIRSHDTSRLSNIFFFLKPAAVIREDCLAANALIFRHLFY